MRKRYLTRGLGAVFLVLALTSCEDSRPSMAAKPKPLKPVASEVRSQQDVEPQSAAQPDDGQEGRLEAAIARRDRARKDRRMRNEQIEANKLQPATTVACPLPLEIEIDGPVVDQTVERSETKAE